MARTAGRKGRPWRTARAAVLAQSTICWLCGHEGADSADHVIPRSACLAMGRTDLLNDVGNLRPAHYRACPVCGIHCNSARGTGQRRQTAVRSRDW